MTDNLMFPIADVKPSPEHCNLFGCVFAKISREHSGILKYVYDGRINYNEFVHHINTATASSIYASLKSGEIILICDTCLYPGIGEQPIRSIYDTYIDIVYGTMPFKDYVNTLYSEE